MGHPSTPARRSRDHTAKDRFESASDGSAGERNEHAPRTINPDQPHGSADGAEAGRRARARGMRRLLAVGHTRLGSWLPVTALVALVGLGISIFGAQTLANSEARDARNSFHFASAEI